MIDFEKVNVNKIAEYISLGEKKCIQKNIGVECEHFIIDKNGEAVSYYGENSVENILERLAEFYPERTYSENHLVGLSDGVVYITLEPAAQIEVSIIPIDDLNKIKDIYINFKTIITNILNDYGYTLINVGYQPKSKVDDLQLIPKYRYRMMDKYFLSKGYKARYMMRGSASVQVNIDYSDENDFSQKFRLANILSPLFYLITDNSSVFESEKYTQNALRSFIWENVDKSRCGVLNLSTYQDYSEWLYNTEPIFIQQNGEDVFCDSLKNKDIFKSREMSVEEIKHIMSMVFPNVRVKQFIEIRPGDSMPHDLMFAYAALIKGLFYNPSVVNELNKMWENVTVFEIEKQIQTIREKGFYCNYLGFDMRFVLEKLFSLAEETLTKEEKFLINPLKELSINFKSPKQSKTAEVAIL